MYILTGVGEACGLTECIYSPGWERPVVLVYILTGVGEACGLSVYTHRGGRGLFLSVYTHRGGRGLWSECIYSPGWVRPVV